jgi:hypothetical protein
MMPRIDLALAVIGSITAALLQPALAEPPKFAVDPTWPQPLPEKWIIGTIGGITVDARDHCCPVKSRTNSIACRFRFPRMWSPFRKVPGASAFSRRG